MDESIFILDCTCFEQPEQYDVYLAESMEKVGYLRLRDHYFYLEMRGLGLEGIKFYEAVSEGYGRFKEGERSYFLERALHNLRDVVIHEEFRVNKRPDKLDRRPEKPLYTIMSSVYVSKFPPLILSAEVQHLVDYVNAKE